MIFRQIRPYLFGCAAALGPFIAFPAEAHHILGVPHYAYSEEYPQTPVLTYSVDAGEHLVRMTGFPGKPVPGDPCNLHVYVSRIDSGESFTGGVTMTVTRDRFIGSDPVMYGPIEAELEEKVYKFFPTFPEEANHVVRIAYEVSGVPWIIDLPMVAGEPGSPWAVVLGVAGGVVGFLIVVRAVHIKRKRRERQQGTTAADPRKEVPPGSEAVEGTA